LTHVLVDLFQSIDFTQLNHFLFPLLLQLPWVLLLLAKQVNRGFNGVAPVCPCIALDRDVVGRSVLQVTSFFDGHGMPREKFGHKLNVLEDFFVDR